MKILSVVGARPQFIKAAMVSRVVRPVMKEVMLHTGQHYDSNMSQIFFQELGLPEPDIHLNVGSGSHAEQTGRMLIGVEKTIIQERPDYVLVYGDTNSTLAGALAAVKLKVPVAHVEAGLRSFNRDMPEEINRVLCDHISDLLFCPTKVSVGHLEAEGVTRGVYEVGDVMGDALDHFIPLAQKRSTILSDLSIEEKKFALATVHRAENTDVSHRLKSILGAFGDLELPVIFPIHPRTRKVIQKIGLHLPANVRIIDPVGYLDMLVLEDRAACILTDSGGIQKEAYWVGVRCITLRDETEWVETVDAGWNKVVSANREAIVAAVNEWNPDQERPPVYGDGHAADKIRDILLESGEVKI